MRGALNERGLPKAIQLGKEIQDAIVSKKLVPAVRTVYRRRAFQRADSNEVRLTLDMGLKLVRERHPNSIEASKSLRALDEPIHGQQIVEFPFAILEIKLQGEMPAWVASLLASDILIPAPKFSKYLTGCAALYTSKMRVLPDWFADPTVEKVLRPAGSSSEDAQARSSLIEE